MSRATSAEADTASIVSSLTHGPGPASAQRCNGYRRPVEEGMMRRYLLVLDMDLLAVDEQLGREPISYLLARQEEQPSEVVVLSLSDPRQYRQQAGQAP